MSARKIYFQLMSHQRRVAKQVRHSSKIGRSSLKKHNHATINGISTDHSHRSIETHCSLRMTSTIALKYITFILAHSTASVLKHFPARFPFWSHCWIPCYVLKPKLQRLKSYMRVLHFSHLEFSGSGDESQLFHSPRWIENSKCTIQHQNILQHTCHGIQKWWHGVHRHRRESTAKRHRKTWSRQTGQPIHYIKTPQSKSHHTLSCISKLKWHRKSCPNWFLCS